MQASMPLHHHTWYTRLEEGVRVGKKETCNVKGSSPFSGPVLVRVPSSLEIVSGGYTAREMRDEDLFTGADNQDGGGGIRIRRRRRAALLRRGRQTAEETHDGTLDEQRKNGEEMKRPW